jgi:hypothetical protein
MEGYIHKEGGKRVYGVLTNRELLFYDTQLEYISGAKFKGSYIVKRTSDKYEKYTNEYENSFFFISRSDIVVSFSTNSNENCIKWCNSINDVVLNKKIKKKF